MVNNEDEYLMLSGIQHFEFCQRQWALIHIEQQWVENVLTIEGQIVHQKADQPFIREKRKYSLKSVIIDKPQYSEISSGLTILTEKINSYIDDYSSISYKKYWTDTSYNEELYSIKRSLEDILNQLSNSTNHEELKKAEEYPIIINSVRPFKPNSVLARICMYVFPVGIILRVLSIPFDLRIINDLKTIRKLNGELYATLNNKNVSGNLETVQN